MASGRPLQPCTENLLLCRSLSPGVQVLSAGVVSPGAGGRGCPAQGLLVVCAAQAPPVCSDAPPDALPSALPQCQGSLGVHPEQQHLRAVLVPLNAK